MNEFINKLIERLEEEKAKGLYAYDSVANVKDAWGKAIEIVNQLAEEYNNDFCEWKSEKDMFIKNPHTGRKFSNEPSMRNVYCNTCGKKIKVVPYQPKGE